MERTRKISKGAAARLVMIHATAAAVRSTNSSPVPFALPPFSPKNTIVNDRRNNSVAPNPNEPKTTDAKKVISAL